MKLQAEAYNFIKKEALAQVFSCEFCSANQWIGFYMITAPVMKELIELLNSSWLKHEQCYNKHWYNKKAHKNTISLN